MPTTGAHTFENWTPTAESEKLSGADHYPIPNPIQYGILRRSEIQGAPSDDEKSNELTKIFNRATVSRITDFNDPELPTGFDVQGLKVVFNEKGERASFPVRADRMAAGISASIYYKDEQHNERVKIVIPMGNNFDHPEGNVSIDVPMHTALHIYNESINAMGLTNEAAYAALQEGFTAAGGGRSPDSGAVAIARVYEKAEVNSRLEEMDRGRKSKRYSILALETNEKPGGIKSAIAFETESFARSRSREGVISVRMGAYAIHKSPNEIISGFLESERDDTGYIHVPMDRKRDVDKSKDDIYQSARMSPENAVGLLKLALEMGGVNVDDFTAYAEKIRLDTVADYSNAHGHDAIYSLAQRLQ